jgi:uncharacterized protein YkwD
MPGRGRQIAVAAVATALITAAIGAASARADLVGCPNSMTAAAELSDDQIETSLVCLINQTRAIAGRRPVRPSAILARAASSYSTWMMLGGYFSHRGADGSTITSRLRYFGYLRPGWSWMVGENLIWGSGPEATPEAIVDSWMESPEHRGNLLRPGFRDLGVGVSHGTPFDADDSDGITVTSEYGARQR